MHNIQISILQYTKEHTLWCPDTCGKHDIGKVKDFYFLIKK